MTPIRRIAIRVDGGHEIGTGHVVRCLRFAAQLRERGVECFFITRAHDGHLFSMLSGRGHRGVVLPLQSSNDTPNGAEWEPLHRSWLGASWQQDARDTIDACRRESVTAVLVDHFGIDARWEREVRSALSAPVIVIDGQADRAHCCDMLIDPSFSLQGAQRWKALVPDACEIHAGPENHFLDPAFAFAAQERARSQASRDGRVRRLVVYFGGTDRHDATVKVLGALRAALHETPVAMEVVISRRYPGADTVRRLVEGTLGAVLHVDPPDFATILSQADLYVGGGGSTLWECCYLGIPMIIVSTAPNQERQSRDLATTGVARYLGPLHDLDTETLTNGLKDAIRDVSGFSDTAKRNFLRLSGRSPFAKMNHLVERVIHFMTPCHEGY